MFEYFLCCNKLYYDCAELSNVGYSHIVQGRQLLCNLSMTKKNNRQTKGDNSSIANNRPDSWRQEFHTAKLWMLQQEKLLDVKKSLNNKICQVAIATAHFLIQNNDQVKIILVRLVRLKFGCLLS